MGNKWRLTESEAAICFKPLFRKICHNKNSGKKFYRLIIFTPHSYMSLEDNNYSIKHIILEALASI